jgi:hypothetical protein
MDRTGKNGIKWKSYAFPHQSMCRLL